MGSSLLFHLLYLSRRLLPTYPGACSSGVHWTDGEALWEP